MTPEEWLRERGIQITRQSAEGMGSGAFASEHTSALPSVPDDAADDDEVANLETQLVPTIVRIDLRLGGDVAEWPTAALLGSPPVILDDEQTDAPSRDERDDNLDYTLEDEMTIPLPAIPARSTATPPPLPPASETMADEVPVDAESSDSDATASNPPGDITTTPTRRLDG